MRGSTQSLFWRRKFSCRSGWDSSSQPFNHESGALPTSYTKSVLSSNPHQQGKSHHRASSAILCLAVCVRDIMTTAGMCGKSVPCVLRQNGSVLQQYRANQCDFVLKSSNSERKRTSVAFKYCLQIVCVCVSFSGQLEALLAVPFSLFDGLRL